MNSKGKFEEANFNLALEAVRKAAGNAKSDTAMRGQKGGSQRNKTYCSKIIDFVMQKNLEPVIVFSFSKNDCVFYANQLSKMNLTEGMQIIISYTYYYNS